jgi:hypothetical protein
MTANNGEGKKKERRRKEEAGPSPIRASRVWPQDDSEKQKQNITCNMQVT